MSTDAAGLLLLSLKLDLFKKNCKAGRRDKPGQQPSFKRAVLGAKAVDQLPSGIIQEAVSSYQLYARSYCKPAKACCSLQVKLLEASPAPPQV